MDWFHCEIKNASHEILSFFIIIQVILIFTYHHTLILLAKVSKVVQPNQLFASWFYSINTHSSLTKEVLIFSVSAWETSIKMLIDLLKANNSDVLRETMIDHLCVVLIFDFSYVQWTNITESWHTFISSSTSRVLWLIYVLLRINQACPFECFKDLMFHSVLSILLRH